MTRDRGIMDIFHQNGHFSNVLVVWEARFQALAIRGATCKTADSLGG
jgi:hypothetical protein